MGCNPTKYKALAGAKTGRNYQPASPKGNDDLRTSAADRSAEQTSVWAALGAIKINKSALKVSMGQLNTEAITHFEPLKTLR